MLPVRCCVCFSVADNIHWSSQERKPPIEEKLLEPIGTHHRSFERYHPRPPTASSSPRLGFPPNQNSNCYYLRNGKSCSFQEREKLQISNLASTFRGSIRTQPMKNFGEKGAWAYPGTAQIFRVPLIISGLGKATDFKFGQIQRVHRV